MKKPTGEDDWITLEFEIQSLFDGAPIDEEELFAGRSTEVRRMLETVFARSKHVVLYGERGVGKTSLSNVFWKRFSNTLKSFIVARVQTSPQDSFSSLWIRALEELSASGQAFDRAELVPLEYRFDSVTPSQVRRELQKCRPNALPIIIIDEYDQLLDQEAKRLTANLIKEFYDFSVTTTVILVGVAENISDLISDHASIDRAIVEVPLRRMLNSELKEIVLKRAQRTSIRFTDDALWTVIVLARGLPYFAQTLAKHAAIHAIAERRLEVAASDVEASMKRFIEDADKRFSEAYKTATRSNQENFFQQSLLACALAKSDDEGFFTANDIVEPYSGIMKERKRIAHFEKHLRRFSTEAGGNILSCRGGDRQQTFRFSDPMMQPYVIIHGIQSGMIDSDAKSLLLQKAQTDFGF